MEKKYQIVSEKITSEEAKIHVRTLGSGDIEKTNKEKINGYRKLMESGKWGLFYVRGTNSKKFINDPIIFLESGRLYEGKHRMLALAKTKDLEIDFWVLRDFGEAEQEIFRQYHEDCVKNSKTGV
ncbi:MAG TPA: hypothetical protein PKA60_01170 [Candidatus Paceibacterota bacterium]|nr:hypothetical protein [Candidatus Paceibacterota bacterium]